jgi:hypothetical protein
VDRHAGDLHRGGRQAIQHGTQRVDLAVGRDVERRASGSRRASPSRSAARARWAAIAELEADVATGDERFSSAGVPIARRCAVIEQAIRSGELVGLLEVTGREEDRDAEAARAPRRCPTSCAGPRGSARSSASSRIHDPWVRRPGHSSRGRGAALLAARSRSRSIRPGPGRRDPNRSSRSGDCGPARPSSRGRNGGGSAMSWRFSWPGQEGCTTRPRTGPVGRRSLRSDAIRIAVRRSCTPPDLRPRPQSGVSMRWSSMWTVRRVFAGAHFVAPEQGQRPIRWRDGSRSIHAVEHDDCRT